MSQTQRQRTLQRMLVTALVQASNQQATAGKTMADVAEMIQEIEQLFAPPPLPEFKLVPAYNGPCIEVEHDEEGEEDPNTLAVRWALSWGFTLSVGADTEGEQLTMGASFSDSVSQRGTEQKVVTREQIRDFATILLRLIDELPPTGEEQRIEQLRAAGRGMPLA